MQTIYGGAFLAGRRLGPGVHAGMAGAEPAPPALLHDSVLGRGRSGRHRRHRAELSLPAPRRRSGTTRHSTSPFAGAAERRSVARPGRQRLGTAGEPAGQQAGPAISTSMATAGFSWRPNADSDLFRRRRSCRRLTSRSFTPFVGGSTIYRLRPMVNLMLESVFTWQDDVVAPGQSERAFASLLSPGVRGGWNRRRTADHRRRRAANRLGDTSRPTSVLFTVLLVRRSVLEA